MTVTSIRYSTAQAKPKPQAGDERFLKGRGVQQIRQQQYSQMYRAYMVSNGRPVWEWVDKGSEKDRTSEAWLQARKLERMAVIAEAGEKRA
ncbi:hypothetical protein [Pseudomonas extremaustralis]|uniref:Uncharacterized protein n=1 Tax=Pseudomonas extremaustralis TaxID=359110 RepID=A0A5C5Q7A5_9PSED|nr:hypothetical protein [Pseudomonas extremaustralis]EZI26389.1 hypothetical protein PE143B_0121630 [Pseudomonas extremaustralis 14-3 substr. 14-3b]TWS01623.1 hypothetical protein FIV36_23595 [Pseudomonas extremaustralis]SDE61316.1 hypothetical protein SAMN05216591_0377 [Pseudomonas extremaustralis]